MRKRTQSVRAKPRGMVAEKRASLKRSQSVDRDLLKRGIKALTKELGPVDMYHFMAMLNSQRKGDYTRDKHKLQPKWTIEDMKRMFVDKQ